jgi:voltage-gated potassium channel
MESRDGRELEQREVRRRRWELLGQVERALEPAMIFLAFIWLGLLVYELVFGSNTTLQWIGYAIWAVFLIDFGFKFVIAPRKVRYLRRNWVTLVSLVIPAVRTLRLVRILRLASVSRATRSLRLVRLLTSLNRSIRAVRTTLARRGVGYVLATTLLVALGGAAGMLAFENRYALRDAGFSDRAGLNSYGEALWWTAMVLTTMGSEYWPRTPEGRILNFLLSVYAFTVFGYITATIATHFIGQDTMEEEENQAELRRELRLLRTQIERLVKE